MKTLTPKQQLFVNEYLVDLNATQAAIRAGYNNKTAYSIGQENLKKPDIQSAIQYAMSRREERTKLTQDRVLQEIERLALFNIKKLYDADGNLIPIKDLDDDTAAAIVGLEVTEIQIAEDITKTITKYKIADKKGALDSAGKHLGMFIERCRVSGEIEVNKMPDLSRMTEDELRALARLGGGRNENSG
jgi:phage terminase small subunit